MKDPIFPLADKLRPETLSDFEGQDHLTAPNKIIDVWIQNQKLVSLIFWGPPGTGKTTVAASLASVIPESVYIDCDVEEPNGHLLLRP